MKDRFAILEAPKNTKDINNLWPGVDATQIDSKYTAFYYPWIEVYDPLTKGPFLVPPGGSVTGIGQLCALLVYFQHAKYAKSISSIN